MAHSETIKKFADFKPHIKLEDEILIVDKLKGTDKVALHVKSTPPPPSIMRISVAKRKVP